MEAFIIYIAKSGVCLGIFLTVYFLFLRPTTLFRFNRIFLLCGFVISLIVPAIKYTYEVVIPVSIIQNVERVNEAASTTTSSAINIWVVLSFLYLIGTFILIGRNMYAYTKLRNLVKNGVKHKNKGFKLVENANINSPFTVLNYILMNTNNLSQIEKDLILKHEITHITQKHWIDLLCSECILILQWFNPLAWAYVKLLKENHEFLADKAVIDSGVSPALYQAVLINQKFQGPVFSFTNSFNYSKPLNRLSMLKKTKSSPWKRAIVLAIIPIFGLFMWASSEPRYVFEQADVSPVTDDSIVVSGYKSTDITLTPPIIVKGKKTNNSTGNGAIEIRGTQSGDFDKALIIIDGKKSSKAEMDKLNPVEIESISVLKDDAAIIYYAEEGKHGVIRIKTKEYAKAHPEPDDHKLDVKVVEGMDMKKRDSQSPASGILNEVSKDWESNRPLIYLDGVVIKDLGKVKPESIESISVLKDSTAISAYGNAGKNGVILVTTKKK